MTAATTPNTASRGDWAWPLKPSPPAPQHLMPTPSPPLELQFLPPSAAAMAAAAASRSTAASASPWTVDPSRLQKLMMGSVSTAAAERLVATSTHDCVSDFGPLFDPGAAKPLPSGWERCLDLKSGKVFIKKCEAMACKTAISQKVAGLQPPQAGDMNQNCWRPIRTFDSNVQADSQRADWSSNWTLGKNGLPTQDATGQGTSAFRKASFKVYGEEERPSSPDGASVWLDLDLRLSGNRSMLASEAPEIVSSQRHTPPASLMNGRDCSGLGSLQTWNWKPVSQEKERPTSIQEMVSESTMATAVCSKCLMYVLLKKSNPTCPRCFNPIILDCGAQSAYVNKRPCLELSPENLSLSTDSSR